MGDLAPEVRRSTLPGGGENQKSQLYLLGPPSCLHLPSRSHVPPGDHTPRSPPFPVLNSSANTSFVFADGFLPQGLGSFRAILHFRGQAGRRSFARLGGLVGCLFGSPAAAGHQQGGRGLCTCGVDEGLITGLLVGDCHPS